MQRTILITGCSSGIGLRAAQLLQERGYRVFATARKAEDVEHLTKLGYEALQLDLNDSESIKAAVEETLDRTGGTLDALFNNGAYGQPGAVEDLRREILQRQFETNVFGWLELTNLLIPVMRKQGHGRIVQNSSVLGLVSLPYRGAYNASKYAIEGLTDTLRLELASTDIKVSLIEPGPITSRFRDNAHAAWKENIDADNSAHKDIYIAMEKRLTKQGDSSRFTLPADAVVDKLIHALESRSPKARYYVTFPTYLMAYLKRFLPNALLDRFLLQISRDEHRQ